MLGRSRAAREFGRPPSSQRPEWIHERHGSHDTHRSKEDGAGYPNTVGVYILRAHLDAHRLRTGGAARFDNGAAGFKELSRWIGSADRVVHEATGHYHRDLEEALDVAGLARST